MFHDRALAVFDSLVCVWLAADEGAQSTNRGHTHRVLRRFLSAASPRVSQLQVAFCSVSYKSKFCFHDPLLQLRDW